MASIILQNISKWFSSNQVIKNVDLNIKDGEFIVFVGPSGCGKSTLLRIISGLEDLNDGTVLIDDLDVTDKVPYDRGLSMVFQSYALYPHMNVFDNIGFSLKTSGVKSNVLKTKVGEVAKILQLEDLLHRLPKQLSGGQKQRVAIGRAIIRKPKAFLFDEPLSNLDAALRVEMRLEISKLHKELGVTTIYVTHDQVEAMTLADKIVVLNEGKIIQIGSPHKLYNYPKNLFVAEFIGTPKMNILNCIKKEEYIYLDENKKTNIKTKKEKIFKLGIRPDNIEICKSEKNILSGQIKFCEYLGSEQYVYVDCGINNKLIIIKIDPNIKVVLNEKIGLKFNSKYVHFFSKDGLRLI